VIIFAFILIRLRDCTKDRHPEWYIGEDIYKDIITTISDELQNSIPIKVCTKGGVEYIDELRQKGINLEVNTMDGLFINYAEITHFVLMAGAKVLVAAGSKFSWLAGVMGRVNVGINLTRNVDSDSIFKAFNPDNDKLELLRYVSGTLMKSWC
jgi:hypothetical protein